MSGQNLFIHVNLMARKKWIEREKGREKVEFPFKKGRGEENKGEKKKSIYWSYFFPLNLFYG